MVNAILIPVAIALALTSLISGAMLVGRSFFGFRAQVKDSLGMRVATIRVRKGADRKDEGQGGGSEQEVWQKEVGKMEELLAALANIHNKRSLLERLFYEAPIISLEIANPSDSEEIAFYIAASRKIWERIEKQIHSYFTDASVDIVDDYTIFAPGSHTAIATLALKNKPALPIRTYKMLEADSLNELTTALSRLDTKEEGAAIQVILAEAPQGWRNAGKKIAHEMQQGKQLKDAHNKNALTQVVKVAASASQSLRTGDVKKEEKAPVQLTPDEQELVKTIENKTRKAAFSVNVRLLASAATQERAEDILSHIENAFVQFDNPDVNRFKVIHRSKGKKTAYRYIFRTFNAEQAMVLNAEEVASIFHLPTLHTATPKITYLKSKTAPPPSNLPEEGALLGFNEYRGVKTDIRLTQDARRRHLYTIGQTGTGKSNFLKELAKQDVREGRGVCIIDPHGDFADDVLGAVPKERAEDVIYFDPSDVGRPLGLNMMEYNTPEQKGFVVNEMINIFDKLYDLKATGGPMFEQYMRNAMLLVMEDPESGSTLMEIPKVMSDEAFRRMKLRRCGNPVVRDFWTKEAEKAGGEAALANMVPYITSKLTPFVANDLMRPIIAQQESTINFREAMDEQKILIVNLSKGKIGEVNAQLLGMIIIGKILMAALARVDMPEDERKDFYLYIDEFQNVTTDSIAQILSEARKYRLSLTIAHQFIGQLSEEITKAVFGNVGSMCAFRVGAEDAEQLEKQFAPEFSAADLMNVDNYNAFAKVLVNGQTTPAFNLKTYPPSDVNEELAGYFKELSRLRYGRDHDIVEKEILARAQLAG